MEVAVMKNKKLSVRCLHAASPAGVQLTRDCKKIKGHPRKARVHSTPIDPPLDGIGAVLNASSKIALEFVPKLVEFRRGGLFE